MFSEAQKRWIVDQVHTVVEELTTGGTAIAAMESAGSIVDTDMIVQQVIDNLAERLDPPAQLERHVKQLEDAAHPDAIQNEEGQQLDRRRDQLNQLLEAAEQLNAAQTKQIETLNAEIERIRASAYNPIQTNSAETPMIDFANSPAFMRERLIANTWKGIALSSGKPIMQATASLSETWAGMFGHSARMQGLFLGSWDAPAKTNDALQDADAAMSFAWDDPTLRYIEWIRLGTDLHDPQNQWYYKTYGDKGLRPNGMALINQQGFLIINADGSIYASQPIQIIQ